MSEDLWGELPDIENLKTPHVILIEQAGVLTNKTKGLLVGHVTRFQEEKKFRSSLQIVTPALNNYTYSVCHIRHDISLYPLEFFGYSGSTGGWSRLESQEQFEYVLGQELQSQSVRNVITGLLAQLKADLQATDTEPGT